MPSQAVQPLRISKPTPVSSPTKPRPLTELSPMERRRNSPSSTQAIKKATLNQTDSSPFDPSPFGGSGNKASPRMFWQGRDPASPTYFGSENAPREARDTSPSPVKRSSIENLKRASRVKNSNMFAREHIRDYDPTSVPTVARPLATGRPLSVQVQGNAYGSRGIDGLRKDKFLQDVPQGYTEDEPTSFSPVRDPTKARGADAIASSHSKDRNSPTKSSLSNPGRFAHTTAFDSESSTWSEEESGGERQLPPGRSLHRHAKSVTFDAAPPQVNEYEMTTPDLSSVGTVSRESSYDSANEEEDESFERGESADIEDSFDASLEDLAKTPVVGPDDARRSLSTGPGKPSIGTLEDPFGATLDASDHLLSHNDSSASTRPLPPLPGPYVSPRLNHAEAAQRALPSPPTAPAAFSKSEIQSMAGARMSLEERLRLIMLHNGSEKALPTSAPEEVSTKNIQLSPTESRKSTGSNADEDSILDADYKLPPRISRESILRKVKTQNHVEADLTFSSPLSSPDRSVMQGLDPDIPIPTVESIHPSTDVLETDVMEDSSVMIKQEDDGEESEFDPYTIPDIYNAPSRDVSDPQARDSLDPNSMLKDQVEDDLTSSYSCDSAGEQVAPRSSSSLNDDGLETPRQASPIRSDPVKQDPNVSLPEFTSMLGDDDFGLNDKFCFGLQSFMTPPPPTASRAPVIEAATNPVTTASRIMQSVPRPSTPVALISPADFSAHLTEDDARSSTPDSVIRHSLGPERSFSESSSVPESAVEPEPVIVPEAVATIKAPSGKLKTRPSITPADAAAMAAVRRQVSGESAHRAPAVPSIPEHHRARPSLAEELHEDSIMTSHRASVLTLDVPVEDTAGDLGLGLDKEFDRLLEAKKRGYLMRQNTKVIVASSDNTLALGAYQLKPTGGRGTRSAGNSPRKGSNERPSWSVEPWNGNMRRKSIKDVGGDVRKRPGSGAAPPMPGQPSNVTSTMESLTEGTAALEERQEGVERGRLFVKVIGVEELKLPLPTGQKSLFNVTLDNGIHCVQTAWLELGRNAPVGQEFELVVLDDLEFTLTLQTEAPKPPVAPAPTPIDVSPTKGVGKIPKASTFSRVFASPRKRKELEKKQQEEAAALAVRQRAVAAQARKVSASHTAWDLLHNLVARDGSFGRSYFSLAEYEGHAFGRPYTVHIPCFNEWATDDTASSSSTRSKHGGVRRRAPYQIGQLELQIFFIPKIQGAKEDDMPKSLNACIRELKEAEVERARLWEGYLSQQGGDCPYWRRRLFKLSGCKLTAYHESTRQPRATINLAKASKLIDDRSSLMQKEATSKGRSRRKSAFAEEEEGYMFVEEGFRVRFANGEVIDFYADSAREKDDWMRVLSEVVGKDKGDGSKKWTDIVLARELSMKKVEGMANAVDRKVRPQSMVGAPTPLDKSPRHQVAAGPTHGHHKRGSMGSVPRSMIF